MEVFVWLTKLLRWGNFRRVPEPLYYRLDHPRSFTNWFLSTDEDRKRSVQTTLFTGLLEATLPVCRTPEERLIFCHVILDRIVGHWPAKESTSSEKIVTECLERLVVEGNTHLLRQEEIPLLLQELKRRPDIKVLERSQMQRLLYRIHQRSQMARVVYPASRTRRVIYQIHYLLEKLRNKTSGPLLRR